MESKSEKTMWEATLRRASGVGRIPRAAWLDSLPDPGLGCLACFAALLAIVQIALIRPRLPGRVEYEPGESLGAVLHRSRLRYAPGDGTFPMRLAPDDSPPRCE